MKTSIWLRGAKFDIVLLSEADETEFESFIEGLTEADQKQADAILERMAHHGPILNEEKSRELEDGIHEFKTRNNQECEDLLVLRRRACRSDLAREDEE